MPTDLSYSLRFPNVLRSSYSHETWLTNKLYPPFSGLEKNSGGDSIYYREGYVQIQDAIARAFVKVKSGNQMKSQVLLQRFPEQTKNPVKEIIVGTLARYSFFLILLAYAFVCVNTVRDIVAEKENQLSEMMKIMGLASSLQWTAWFLSAMLCLSISIILIVIMLSVSEYLNTNRRFPRPDSNIQYIDDLNFSQLRIYTFSNWIILWLLFTIYGISTITFSFFVSAFISKTSCAYYVTALLCIASIFPHFFVTYEDITFTEQLLVCLTPNSAMLYAVHFLTDLELLGDGMQWSNVWHSSLYGDNLPIGIIMVFMLLTSVALLLITLYIERVLPGAYGVAEPWYFPFTKVFWCGGHPRRDDPHSRSDNNDDNFEKTPDNLHSGAGIQIKSLRKVFSSGKVAVDNLSVNMFENQITVLLGHNGAGKSTTIAMLTGMLQPTSGTALINGYDIRTETKKARSSFGLCAQHNVLFDELTVREHIVFYSMLKGLDARRAENEVIKYIGLLNLAPEKIASTLSGGMKRKLSLANALCANSKFLLCDEPSSGMDPTARRELWTMLQSEKKTRTILLTTHYMDEADILGDRIAMYKKQTFIYIP